ncbi:MAG: MXAN_2562 family outer membrane beta-barrel protein [Polyangiaceae bacterium]|nr:MXAN_2562 family outer membrane beta-barrel protein [Polyangiaceae bacterium]
MTRRLTILSLAFTASATTATSVASALEFGTPASEHPGRSAQNFAIEVRVGPYKPQVDSEPALGSKTPYNTSFGSAFRILPALEFDWQTLRIPGIGTIGPGVSIGYTRMSADSVTLSGRPSGDTTSLSIIPMTLVGVLRVDVLWRKFGVPLVPYGKAGLGYALWTASNTGGTSDANGVKGEGHSLGTNFALGLAFSLDAFDTYAARNMDIATGINNSYVFVEAYRLTLNGFGSSSTLRVGSGNTWTAGLAFEF